MTFNEQVAQTNHKDKLATERALIRLTGLSRSQIRDALARNVRDFQQRQADNAAKAPVVVQPTAPPAPTISVQKFEPKPLTIEPEIRTVSNPTSSIPDPPATGVYVYGSIDGVAQWIPTETCPDDV